MTDRKNGRGGRAGARTPIAALAVLIGLLVFGVLFPAADATLANRVGGPGLALLYTFDANAGTVVADQTGAGGAKGDPWDQTLNRGYWLTDLGSPLPSGVLINETCVPPCAPPINNATAVTGKLDSITELVPLFASTNAEFSVEAWVEPTDANTAGIIFDTHVAGGADESFACVPGDATFGGDSISLRQVANGTYVCIVGDNGGTPTATECTAADTITAGGRYHVVATVDAASAVTLYVNGAATAAVCTPTATSFGGYATAWAANATERQVSIGARGNGFGTFLGNVHLVAFYTEALNSSEVLRNYETGAFNEAPVPVSAAYNYTEDGNLTVALTATDSDPRDSASFVVTSLPVAGSLFQLSGVGVKGAAIAVNDTVTSPNGELLFEPSPNANGDQTFTFSASDGVDTSTADGVITLSGLAVDDASIVTAPATATTIDRVVTVNDIVVSDVDGGNVTVSVAVSNGTVTLRNTTNNVSFTTGDGVDDATVVFTVDTTSTGSTHDFDLVYTANCVTFTRTDAITVMAATPGNVFGMPAITAVDIPFVPATVMPTTAPSTLKLGATANINVSISALPQCNPDVVLTPVSTPVDSGVVTFVPAALTYNASAGPLTLQLTGDTLGTATLSFTASNGEVDVGGVAVNVTVVPVPTTVAPTTVAPTTVAPTTVAPTTIAPTTVAPTTVAPSTVAPTTVAPTTAGPTTAAPTTVAPTTAAPTTVAPTTAAPSTTIGPTTTSAPLPSTTLNPNATVAPTTTASPLEADSASDSQDDDAFVTLFGFGISLFNFGIGGAFVLVIACLCCVFFWLCVNEMCAIPEEDLLINDEGDDIEMRVAKAEKKATHEIKPIETVRVVYGDEADVDMDVSLIPFPEVQPPPPTEPPPKFEVSTLRRKKVKAPKTFAMGHASALSEAELASVGDDGDAGAGTGVFADLPPPPPAGGSGSGAPLATLPPPPMEAPPLAVPPPPAGPPPPGPSSASSAGESSSSDSSTAPPPDDG